MSDTPRTPEGRKPLPKRGRGRPTRNRNPYTEAEKKRLRRWHEKAKTTRGVSKEDAPERRYGDMFAAAVADKRAEKPTGGQFTWKELAEPLGIEPRTLHAYLARRGYAPLKEGGTRPVYKGRSANARHRTEEYFPCGIHKITPENSYPPARPGGVPRDKLCEKESRKRRYYERERDQRKAARDAARNTARTTPHESGEAA